MGGIATIDAPTEAQVGKDLGVKANDPMALDEDDQRLFVVTRRPPFVLKLDTNTRQEVVRVQGGGSCDDVYYDGSSRRAAWQIQVP